LRLGLLLLVMSAGLDGCAATSSGWLAASGPDRAGITKPRHDSRISAMRLIDVDLGAVRRLQQSKNARLFSEVLRSKAESPRATNIIGPGDVLGVAIWEAPPAALFSPAALGIANGTTAGFATSLPQQVVEADGSIEIPFAGSVSVAGKSPQQVDADIQQRLSGKANQPQVVVQIVNNNSATVTIVGDVVQSVRMPLTPKGERLLDAIAAAGGTRDPVNKISVQITRGTEVHTLPLNTVIQSPRENVSLAPGDVVTALFQSQSFTVLGATAANSEITFEAQGISLAQAIARSGGLQDTRADAKGVFIFRFEDPNTLTDDARSGPTASDGRVPVIYRLDLKDPASFLLAQDFPMRDHDILYVATAPSAELQKFLTILTSSIYSVYSLINLGN